ncbi:MAG: DUF262 domain-containing HNH endonuclease family protein [Candidatus Azobacteroides sp.]|nr:DUF262 domain-containing HNH endonuclease family protein [Candidatus Azobacteroides sp.]
MTATFKNLRDYLYQNDKQFVVPNYQRGYKWAVKEEVKSCTAVEYLLDCLILAYNENKTDYFLQGITVSEKEKQIILIDGQQRTTTLYLLLWSLDKENINDIATRHPKIDLYYDIRQQSRDYINNLHIPTFDYTSSSDDFQDIYYFKEAIKQINKKIEKISDKDDFTEFLLNKVQIIYINIDESKAVQTFTMMNGNKATMLPEELIKAEMLRKVSLPDKEKKEVSTSVDENLSELKEIIAKDWETNAIRSKYAREWDKWLYWWNRTDVQNFFGVSNPMGLLLEYCFKQQQSDKKVKFSFDSFKSLLSGKKQTKEQFKKLRDLQKSFEDIFNTPKVFNYLGLALKRNIDKYEAINYFIENKKNEDTLKNYAKWSLVEATHLEITDYVKSETLKEDKARIVLSHLSEKIVYNVYNEDAFKQLLRLNVEEDNKLNRKFDFEIYKNRSLEHIFPKSRVYHKSEVENDDGSTTIVFKDGNEGELGAAVPTTTDWLNRDSLTDCTEHSIGNLLLLDKNDNSKFNNSDFDKKKYYYFDATSELYSRNLLHTISVFANSNWGKTEIEKNQKEFIVRFTEDYKLKN